MWSSRSCLFLVVLGCLAGSGSAQSVLAPGDIGAVVPHPSTFYVVNPASGLVTPYNVGAFTGGGNALCILWDPAVPDSFLIGGWNFIGRATVLTAPSLGAAPTGVGAVYTPLITTPEYVGNMQWDDQRNLIFRSNDRIGHLDMTTNTVTWLTSPPHPWAARLGDIAVNILNGDIYAGGNPTVYRMTRTSTNPPAYTAPALFATGWCTNPTGSACPTAGLEYDTTTSDLYAVIAAETRVIRITQDASGVFTGWSDICPVNQIVEPRSATFDANRDLIIGTSGNIFGGLVSRVSLTATPPVIPTLLAAIPWSASCTGPFTCPPTGLSIVGGAPFVIPAFRLSVTGGGCTPTTINVLNPPTGVTEGWTLGSVTLPAVPGGGWFAGLIPDALTWSLINANATGPCAFPFPVRWSTSCWQYPYVFGPIVPCNTQMDLVAIGLGPNGYVMTDVVRHTW